MNSVSIPVKQAICANQPRMNAYREEYEFLGKERVIVDRKGTWEIHHVGREKINQFYSYIAFTKSDNVAHFESGHVFFWDHENMSEFKKSIKGKIGYTPTKETLEQLWQYADHLRKAHHEEDLFYSNQDKEAAKTKLSIWLKTAIERFHKGDEIPIPVCGMYNRGRHPIEKFLTKDERKDVEECQKVINGHAFVEQDYNWCSGHLFEFKKMLDDRITEEKKQIERHMVQKQQLELQKKLEYDVEFRWLVGYALLGSKENRTKGVRYELAHMLFGYTQSLESFQRVQNQFFKLMNLHGLKPYDDYLLVKLGKQYIETGEYLPEVSPRNEREEGRFYYGDRVRCGEQTGYVLRVGLRYVYLDNGKKFDKKLTVFNPKKKID